MYLFEYFYIFMQFVFDRMYKATQINNDSDLKIGLSADVFSDSMTIMDLEINDGRIKNYEEKWKNSIRADCRCCTDPDWLHHNGAT